MQNAEVGGQRSEVLHLDRAAPRAVASSGGAERSGDGALAVPLALRDPTPAQHKVARVKHRRLAAREGALRTCSPGLRAPPKRRRARSAGLPPQSKKGAGHWGVRRQ